MANADGSVLPKPGIPKTLGILNVIFGVLLILMGLCGIGSLLVAPAGMKMLDNIKKEVEAKAEAQTKEQLKNLDDQEKAAKTEEEKKAIEQQRATVIAKKANVPQMDMGEVDKPISAELRRREDDI